MDSHTSTKTPSTQKLSWARKGAIVLVCALSYYALFELNLTLFDDLEFAQGVNWVFLPSGVRLLFILIFSAYGGLGVALGSAMVNYTLGDWHDHVFNLVTSFISGFSPYLARLIAVDIFAIDVDLGGMSSRIFFKITLLFALISATLHQLWFFWRGQTQNFLMDSWVMFVGDWLGTVLVLAFVHALIKLFGKFYKKD